MTLKSSMMAVWTAGMVLLLGGCVSQTHQPPPPPETPAHLHGVYHDGIYTSPEGGFSVTRPVSAYEAVHGRIAADNARGVTFADDWGSRITFKSEPILEHSPMMTMLEGQGREKALTEFAHRAYGDLIDIHYHPDVREGTVSFLFLRPVPPKTGVAIFIQGHRLFVTETDMLPGAELLGQSDAQSQLERDAWLESAAVTLAQSIQTR